MQVVVDTLDEPKPGPKWARFFEASWPEYREWFLQEGDRARPTYLASRRALQRHMPELMETYGRLMELAGGSDLAARGLALYCPPPYLTACSQAAWTRSEPMLVRNYDYAPRLWEKLLVRTHWRRRVLGMSDCLWGLLDGVNDAGLCVSLSFGGRKQVGDGFGIPLILRYVLETCDTTREATEVLQRVPSHMSYSITLLDASVDHATVFVTPDRGAQVTRNFVATNHQEAVEWSAYAKATRSAERLSTLSLRLSDPTETAARFVQRFLEAPAFGTRHEQGYGTLYTAVYRPKQRSVSLLWPQYRWEQSLDRFDDQSFTTSFAAAPA